MCSWQGHSYVSCGLGITGVGAIMRVLLGESISRLLSCDGVRGGRGDFSLGLFIKGDHGVFGRIHEVGVGEGGGLLSVRVLVIAASLVFSSFGGCSLSVFTSGMSAEAGGSLATVGVLLLGGEGAGGDAEGGEVFALDDEGLICT